MSFCMSRRAIGVSLSPRAPIMAVAIALLAGGCAANTAGPSKVAGPVSGYPGDPVPRPAVSKAAPVEMEDDGFPAQVAPKHRRPMRDEPTEPWSPNYGTVRSDGSDVLPMRTRVAIAPAAPLATQAVAPRFDPDDIIRIAIAEHEMRRR